MNKIKAIATVVGVAATGVLFTGIGQANAASPYCGTVSYQGVGRGNACYYSAEDKLVVGDQNGDGYWIRAHFEWEKGQYNCDNKKGGGKTVSCVQDVPSTGDITVTLQVMDGSKVLAKKTFAGKA